MLQLYFTFNVDIAGRIFSNISRLVCLLTWVRKNNYSISHMTQGKIFKIAAEKLIFLVKSLNLKLLSSFCRYFSYPLLIFFDYYNFCSHLSFETETDTTLRPTPRDVSWRPWRPFPYVHGFGLYKEKKDLRQKNDGGLPKYGFEFNQEIKGFGIGKSCLFNKVWIWIV